MSFKCRECDKVIMSFKRDTCPQCVAKADDVEAKFNREWAERQERMRRDAYRVDDERMRRLREEAARVRQQAEADAAAVAFLMMDAPSRASPYSYSNPAPVAPSPLYNLRRETVTDDTPTPCPAYTRCDDSPSYTTYDSSSDSSPSSYSSD